jgi:Sushi repeat (SCR repeat)
LKGNCKWVSPAEDSAKRELYSAKIKVSRRLYAIRLNGANDYRYSLRDSKWNIKYIKSDWSFEELKNVRPNYDEHNNHITLVIDKYQHLKEFQFLKDNIGYTLICGIEILAYYDECGHPEVPLHGQVQWTPDDANATYRCDEGYHLESNVSTRYCIQGKWNGPELTCM